VAVLRAQLPVVYLDFEGTPSKDTDIEGQFRLKDETDCVVCAHAVAQVKTRASVMAARMRLCLIKLLIFILLFCYIVVVCLCSPRLRPVVSLLDVITFSPLPNGIKNDTRHTDGG
jgi:hypothetical protein